MVYLYASFTFFKKKKENIIVFQLYFPGLLYLKILFCVPRSPAASQPGVRCLSKKEAGILFFNHNATGFCDVEKSVLVSV